MFFKRFESSNKQRNIQEGALFQRTHANNLIETARVLSIGKDSFGIPHVKYEVKFDRSRENGHSFDGPRVLALSVFAENFNRCAEPG